MKKKLQGQRSYETYPQEYFFAAQHPQQRSKSSHTLQFILRPMIKPWQWSQVNSMLTISWSSPWPSGFTPPEGKNISVRWVGQSALRRTVSKPKPTQRQGYSQFIAQDVRSHRHLLETTAFCPVALSKYMNNILSTDLINGTVDWPLFQRNIDTDQIDD